MKTTLPQIQSPHPGTGHAGGQPTRHNASSAGGELASGRLRHRSLPSPYGVLKNSQAKDEFQKRAAL